MTLNPDCIREILMTISDELVPDDDGDITPISPDEFVSNKMSDFPKNETLYWIRKLMDEEILVKGTQYIDESLPQIKDISMAGYKFIEATQNTTIWEKIKPKLAEATFSSLTALINAGIAFILS